MRLEKRFPKKRVIITGSGSGLGRATALEFAKRGWSVGIAEISKMRAGETAELARRAGGAPLLLPCDVTKPEDFERVLRRAVKEWGGVDILVNNAGVAAAGYFEKIPLDRWDWILDINLKSIVYGCRAFIPRFKKQGYGHIVNVASNAGIASLPEMASYNVTKAAAISASETLRLELSPHNIGVTVVCPTFFKTNLMDQFSSTDERQKRMAERFFEKAKTTSEAIARHLIVAIEKNRFYVITQADGRFVWWSKRHFPELYYKAVSWGYKRGIMDRYLGVDAD